MARDSGAHFEPGFTAGLFFKASVASVGVSKYDYMYNHIFNVGDTGVSGVGSVMFAVRFHHPEDGYMYRCGVERGSVIQKSCTI